MKNLCLTIILTLTTVIFSQRQTLTTFQGDKADEFSLLPQPIWEIASPDDCEQLSEKTFFYVMNDVLTAINLQTGTKLWERFGFSCDLSYGDGLIFTTDGKDVYALEEDTGNLKWQVSFETDYGLDFNYTGEILFVTPLNEIGEATSIFAINAQDSEILWEREADRIYFNFEVLGDVIKVNHRIQASVFGGVRFLDLNTGGEIWGLDYGRGVSNYLLYVDDKYAYSLHTYGASPTFKNMQKIELKTGNRIEECSFYHNSSALAFHYGFFPIGATLDNIISDGEWVYGIADGDLHRFLLCGTAPAIFPPPYEVIEYNEDSRRTKEELITLVFSWMDSDTQYFTLNNSLYMNEHYLKWVGGPVEGVFLFYNNVDRRLYGVDRVPRNYIEVLESKEGKLASKPFHDKTEPVNLKEYPGIKSEISRLEIINNMIFLGTLDGVFHIFDLHTQELIFRTRVNSPNFGPFHLVDDIAVVQTLNGDVMAFKLDLPK